MRPTSTTLTFNEYLTESRTLDAARKWLRKNTVKTGNVLNKKLKLLLERALSSLFEPSEATKLNRQINAYSTTLVASFEELQQLAKTVVNDTNDQACQSKQLKALSIKTRQLTSQFLTTLEDYRRSTTKGGKLARGGKIDKKLYAEAIRKLEAIEKLCDQASKAAAFLTIDNVEAASKQLQFIINTKL
ncbi:TPA: hypothetical protein ACF367_003780 [Vibrio parahaemolyticus]|uniref:hypothetical protein n=1 Tax=Vibrio parahaemolyticus TaxID=670 RepID=UPI00111CE04A|nr:hypothetical protein [Vibrio parahaemolyticus]MDF4399551.1 hypothetical protein [Vibrio parahaemolyticus]MDL2002836.1 hypothetical protein [Vibrio parahaemolyticus]TOE04861.1 hypothetical protein CGJ52_13550 [Vibrio parahaemolyticus]TOE06435.1 hypothetical protein CGJ51_18730 [Vibrio parahaemolyticus]TOE16966.1 hypothetical protein CGJ49_21480 [Vibrio parahaemolyticus]